MKGARRFVVPVTGALMLAGLLIPFAGPLPVVADAPPTDDWIGAPAIESLPFASGAVDTTGATEQDEETYCGLSQAVWYQFTPDADIYVRAEVTGDFDARVALYGALSAPSQNPTCSYTGAEPVLQLSLTAEQTYYFALGGADGASGTASFSLTVISPPGNDTSAGAVPVSELPYGATVDVNATTDPLWPGAAVEQCLGIPSVWFSFVPTSDMTVRAQLSIDAAAGAGAYGFVAAYQEGSGEWLDLMACRMASTPYVQIDVAAQTQYWFAVGSPANTLDDLFLTVFDIASPPSRESAAADLAPRATLTTDDEDDGATRLDPIETWVTTTNAGWVTINESATAGPGPVGYSLLGFHVSISAPSGSFDDPITIRLRLDASAVPDGQDEVTLQLLRNGIAVADCLVPPDGTATPDPCISDRTRLGDGDVELVALTSAASVWQLAVTGEVPPDLGTPANDNWANATAIYALPFSGSVDTSNATDQQFEAWQEGCPSVNQTVWYAFTPDEDIYVRADTAGSDFDAMLFLYAVASSRAPFRLACEPGIDGLQVSLIGDQTYYLALGGRDGASGEAVLNLLPLLPPANDAFGEATVITSAGLPYSTTVAIDSATDVPGWGGEPLHYCGGSVLAVPYTASVWYSITPDHNMAVRADVSGTDGLKMLAAFEASSGEWPDQIACRESNSTESLQLALVENTQYWFEVGGTPGAAGDLAFSLVELAATPGNDNWADAFLIPGLPYAHTVDTGNATNQRYEASQEGCSLGDTVWYAFTPLTDIAVRADTDGSDFDAGLMVFTAGSNPFPELLTCDPGATDGIDGLQLSLVGGQTYYFTLGARDGSSGNAIFHLTQLSPPSNDTIANGAPIVTADLPFSAPVDVDNATVGIEREPSCYDTPDLWYSFTPDHDMAVRAEASGTDGLTVLAVYEASSRPWPVEIACRESTSTVRLQLDLTENQPYWISVGGAPGASGDLVFSLVDLASPPDNDDWASASTILELPYTDTIDTTNATIGRYEDEPCGLSQTVWYAFTPDEDIAVRADTDGSDFDAGLILYTVGSSPFLQRLGCEPGASDGIDGLQLSLVGGQTYYFALAGRDGSSGNAIFNLTQLSPPSNDAFGAATLVTPDDLPYGTTVAIDDATEMPDRGGEPWSCFDGPSVWYTFTPEHNMAVRAEVGGADELKSLAVFEESSREWPYQIACRESTAPVRLPLTLVASTRYWFKVGGVPGAAGDLVFSLRDLKSPPSSGESRTVEDVPAHETVTTDIEDNGATPNDPIETWVTTAASGDVAITEAPTSGPPPTGYSIAGFDITISAPDGAWDNPIVIALRLDASAVPQGQDETTLQLLRNGTQVPACTGAPDTADPNPCVATRERLGDGDIRLVALTSVASLWQFAVLLDNTAPTITVPADVAVPATSGDGAIVTYSASFEDAGSGLASSGCEPPSGSMFAIGTTTVVCSATDLAGNSDSKSFYVTVTAPYATKQAILAELKGLGSTGDKENDKKIAEAIRHLERSLSTDLWVTAGPLADGRHLSPEGKKVFDEEKHVVHQLAQINDPSAALAAQIVDWIEQLEDADMILAQTAIDEATDAKSIEQANRQMTAAQRELTKGNLDSAFDHWKNAWDKATR